MQGESKIFYHKYKYGLSKDNDHLNYFPGDRDIQEYPHKINHMAKDKN